MHRQAPEGHRVLVVAPFGRDAETIGRTLREHGYDACVCADVAAVAGALDARSGVVLLTEEALQGELGVLARALEAQPAWSDMPFVLLASPRTGRLRSAELARLKLPAVATNVIVLERPLGLVSLLSAIDAAMRARQRQLEMRDRLAELDAQARALRESREALVASEAELRHVADALPVLIAFVDRDLRYRFANRAYESWFGICPQALVGRSVMEVVGEEGFRQREAAMRRALAGEPMRLELPWPHRDGRRRDADIRYLPRRDAQGDVDGFHVFVLDVTERNEAEELLRLAAGTLEEKVAERTAELHAEMARRAETEAALRQSQKMEAVGQLTGGIAHDFNNMLTGIIGAIDIVRLRVAAGRSDGIDRFLASAHASAQRAAALTARLLAFSRRQSLDSRPLDVDALLRSLSDLLQRTLGENVRLRIVAGDVPPAVADANQLENAILNLAINARDAMPAGGLLTIETGTAELGAEAPSPDGVLAPGRYVTVTVADTGVGMSAEILERVFEPFFTTKPLGQGTGLGLSMVYGFARQSNGQVRVHSEPGSGTRVCLYLPAAGQHTAVPVLPTHAPRMAGGNGQSVLVVEDDPGVRLLLRELLGELGYTVMEAAEAQAAIPVLASRARIDLLVSDVGLPGMNGRQLAEVARGHRPDLPILFVTGYAENAAIRAGFLGTNMGMITKPFALDALAAKVEDMLGAG
ncbi:PAS domain-containing protein [Coralloluteibacterium thermophilus]|uniref:histidine kinase n=1 Tax=Coralloluteibacterium thermophilum TaxID=2707049 RepID=A0ABV9NFV8_9GAMM